MNNEEFPILHYSSIDNLQEYSNPAEKLVSLQTSTHNELFDLYLLRLTMINEFQKVLAKKNQDGKFEMKISKKHSMALFAHLEDQRLNFKQPEIPIEQSIRHSNVNEIFYTDNEDKYHINKVDYISDPVNSFNHSIPFPEMLCGFLSNDYFKFPLGLSKQRSGNPDLRVVHWNYIAKHEEQFHVTYDLLSNNIIFYIPICSSNFDTMISQPSLSEKLNTYQERLVGKLFYDHIFDWQFIVAQVANL